jgi:hypothetical protein
MKRSKHWEDLAARVAAYKTLHAETAKSKGVYEAFMAAMTLTQAKKILRGEK